MPELAVYIILAGCLYDSRIRTEQTMYFSCAVDQVS